MGQMRRGIERGMVEWKWQWEVIADAKIRGRKWRALRIKAICIPAPLSFLMSFIQPLLNLPTTQQPILSSKRTTPVHGSRMGKKKNAFKGTGRESLAIDSSSFWSLFLFQSLADSSLLLLYPHFATILPTTNLCKYFISLVSLHFLMYF